MYYTLLFYGQKINVRCYGGTKTTRQIFESLPMRIFNIHTHRLKSSSIIDNVDEVVEANVPYYYVVSVFILTYEDQEYINYRHNFAGVKVIYHRYKHLFANACKQLNIDPSTHQLYDYNQTPVARMDQIAEPGQYYVTKSD